MVSYRTLGTFLWVAEILPVALSVCGSPVERKSLGTEVRIDLPTESHTGIPKQHLERSSGSTAGRPLSGLYKSLHRSWMKLKSTACVDLPQQMILRHQFFQQNDLVFVLSALAAFRSPCVLLLSFFDFFSLLSCTTKPPTWAGWRFVDDLSEVCHRAYLLPAHPVVSLQPEFTRPM